MKKNTPMAPRRLDEIQTLSFLRGVGARLAVVLLIAATFARTSSDLFHDHTEPFAHQAGVSAPCNACDVQTTSGMEGSSQAELPATPVTGAILILAPETHPYVSPILRTSGRAPPCG
jgi:hypothetical protein